MARGFAWWVGCVEPDFFFALRRRGALVGRGGGGQLCGRRGVVGLVRVGWLRVLGWLRLTGWLAGLGGAALLLVEQSACQG